MGDPNCKNYASGGRQAGVFNVHFASTSAPYWVYDYRNSNPGFLLGPPGYFGTFPENLDARSVV